jgi:enamine deaminase RidA (YjgF/YER057c/UK114 family)
MNRDGLTRAAADAAGGGATPRTARQAVDPDAALRELGIVLPPPPPGVSTYETTYIAGNTLYMSGQLPWVDGALRYKGAVGRDVTLEQGYDSARLSCINAIAQLRHALGGFERLKQIIRMEGVIYTRPDYDDAPKVLDGATDLLLKVFGDRGRHTRMLYSQQAMPLGATTLVIVWAEVKS